MISAHNFIGARRGWLISTTKQKTNGIRWWLAPRRPKQVITWRLANTRHILLNHQAPNPLGGIDFALVFTLGANRVIHSPQSSCNQHNVQFASMPSSSRPLFCTQNNCAQKPRSIAAIPGKTHARIEGKRRRRPKEGAKTHLHIWRPIPTPNNPVICGCWAEQCARLHTQTVNCQWIFNSY